MTHRTATASEPAVTAKKPTSPADAAQKRAIAEALWTEVHWLMPTDRTVTITVEGDDVDVEFGQRNAVAASPPP